MYSFPIGVLLESFQMDTIKALDKAKELMKEAGYGEGGKPLTIKYRYNSSAINTDIAVAAGTEVLSILVMSGETTPEMLASNETKPDLTVENIGRLAEML